MEPIVPRHQLLEGPEPAGRMTRRRFLAGLGVLAGASAMAPLLRRVELERTHTVEVVRPALGTWVRVVARHRDRPRAERGVAAAFAAIATVDRQMSVHRADSDLARVNHAAGSGASAVDPAVIDVVARACAAAERSGGIYDPTVLPLMRLYGFDGASAADYPNDRAIAGALEKVGWRGVTWDAGPGTLGLSRSGAGLDLGSIGKGWALDRAVDALRAADVPAALVDVGGNSYGYGSPRDGVRGWSVGVLHPVTRQVDRVFVLDGQAIATSGNAEQYRILSGLRVGHLFDARHGRPAEGHLSATVVATNGVTSDVLSTVAFLLGPSRFQRWPEALDSHFIG